MAVASMPGETTNAARPSHVLSGSAVLAWRREMLAVPGPGRASSASLDWLLDLAGGIGWSSLQGLWLHPQRRVTLARPLPELEALWLRHCRLQEPLQYLVGVCPWRDLELAVAPGVLIPRQETELLAELALRMAAPPPALPRLRWADLGTGSGCLALALARGLPGSRGLAVDASGEALRQARHNLSALLPPGSVLGGPSPTAASMAAPEPAEAARGGACPVTLRQGHWWQAIEPWWGRLDLVVSNPPYIPSAVLAGLEPVVRDHEPTLALDGGIDGLEAIRAIVAGAPRALAPGGLLLLEHHHDQSAAVLALMAAAGLEDGRAHHDLEGVARFAGARRAGEGLRPDAGSVAADPPLGFPPSVHGAGTGGAPVVAGDAAGPERQGASSRPEPGDPPVVAERRHGVLQPAAGSCPAPALRGKMGPWA